MSTSSDSMADVRHRFSDADAADKWHRMYASETDHLDEANFRERRDVTVDYVMRLVSPGDRVLDLGCGAGPVLTELRRRGVDVTGIDYSEDMLENARRRLRAERLGDGRLFQGDCRDTGLPAGSFDVIVCLGVIAYMEDYDPVLDEIRRLLKPGGVVLISFRNAFNPVFSDPATLFRRLLRTLATPFIGPRRDGPFRIGRYLDFREVTQRLRRRDFEYMDFFGIGFGPFRIAGRPLFSERFSIRLSQLLGRCARALGLRHPLRWLTDVSLWVYRRGSSH